MNIAPAACGMQTANFYKELNGMNFFQPSFEPRFQPAYKQAFCTDQKSSLPWLTSSNLTRIPSTGTESTGASQNQGKRKRLVPRELSAYLLRMIFFTLQVAVGNYLETCICRCYSYYTVASRLVPDHKARAYRLS
jgi:hypothetical protein